MDSSFLTLVNAALGVFAVASALKLVIRYGWPGHPLRLTVYLVSTCAAFYFGMKALVGLGAISPFVWLRWRSLPLVVGSLGLLLQIVGMVGRVSLLQQKIFSRLPLMAGLLVFAFFPAWADHFLTGSLLVGMGFLSVSVGKARHQKRLYFKMALFMGASLLLSFTREYWPFVLGAVFQGLGLFYFFLFQESLTVKALVEDFSTIEGKPA